MISYLCNINNDYTSHGLHKDALTLVPNHMPEGKRTNWSILFPIMGLNYEMVGESDDSVGVGG